MPCSWPVHFFERSHLARWDRRTREKANRNPSQLGLALVVEMLRWHSHALKIRCVQGVRRKFDALGKLQHICTRMQLLSKEIASEHMQRPTQSRRARSWRENKFLSFWFSSSNTLLLWSLFPRVYHYYYCYDLLNIHIYNRLFHIYLSVYSGFQSSVQILILVNWVKMS